MLHALFNTGPLVQYLQRIKSQGQGWVVTGSFLELFEKVHSDYNYPLSTSGNVESTYTFKKVIGIELSNLKN